MKKIKGLNKLNQLLINYDKSSQNRVSIEVDYLVTSRQVKELKKELSEVIKELRVMANG